MADDNFFAMPPSEEPPMPPADGGEPGGDGGFTLIGDAPPMDAPPPMLGDVNEAPADMGFAGGEFGAAPVDDAFGAPPADDPYGAPDDAFASPPVEDTPIILGSASGDSGAPVVEDAEPAEPSEPSPMQKWNEDWQQILTERKDEENTKKAEMVEASRTFMENFQKESEAKREAKMAKNREDEQAKLEAIEADLENDNSWQKVCKMVELSHDGANDGADVKRMRDVLILLKNEPARAAEVGA